jgi:hypothetical protein
MRLVELKYANGSGKAAEADSEGGRASDGTHRAGNESAMAWLDRSILRTTDITSAFPNREQRFSAWHPVVFYLYCILLSLAAVHLWLVS